MTAMTFLTGCSSLSKKFTYEVKKDFVFLKDRPDLKMDIYRPQSTGRLPVVLVIHGGGWRSRSGDMASVCRDLAAQGFVALNLTYRLAPQHVYPAALEDVRTALKFVRDFPADFGVDPERIFVWGFSAGGHLALMLGLPADSGIKAIVAGAAPSNLSAYPRSPLVKMFLGKNRDDDPELWKSASPISHVSKDSPPVYMYHGKSDMIVGVDQTRALKALLEKNGVPVQTKEIGWGSGHLSTYLFSQSAVDEGIAFLLRWSR